MTALEILKHIRSLGGSVRIEPDGALRYDHVPGSLIPVLTRLKADVADLLRNEDPVRLCVCPECKAEFDSPNACADHMRFECPLWCPDCNKFIVRNGVCPGCGLKPITAQRCDENFLRLKSRFNLKSVSWKRMREITDGQPWQVLPKNSGKTVTHRRAGPRTTPTPIGREGGTIKPRLTGI